MAHFIAHNVEQRMNKRIIYNNPIENTIEGKYKFPEIFSVLRTDIYIYVHVYVHACFFLPSFYICH